MNWFTHIIDWFASSNAVIEISINILASAILAAFIFGARLMYALVKETSVLRKHAKTNDEVDKAQQQAIDELRRAVAVLQNEDKTLEARVSAANILLTSVTAQRVL